MSKSQRWGSSPWLPGVGIFVVLASIGLGLVVSESPSQTFWIGLGALCSGVAAIATAILALFTYRMASKTGAEAAATVLLAEEAQRDRQMLWQPQLEMLMFNRNMGTITGRGYGSFDLSVRNSGSAPALQVIIVARDGESSTRWAVVTCGDLRPGESFRAGHMGTEGDPFVMPFEGVSGVEATEYVSIVVLCRDVLGRRLRFAFTTVRWPGGGDNPNDTPGFRPLAMPDIEEGPDWPEWAVAPVLWIGTPSPARQ